MARLIDADALKIEIVRCMSNLRDCRGPCDVINDAPTIDAVEVVRCRECRHHDPAPSAEGTVYCSQWDICVSDVGYCHCGEMDNHSPKIVGQT